MGYFWRVGLNNLRPGMIYLGFFSIDCTHSLLSFSLLLRVAAQDNAGDGNGVCFLDSGLDALWVFIG